MTNADDSLLRILISTDNHLGYAEKDVVIGDDSFRNFEHVLKAALDAEADFVLLGGDLFHDSEPSKHTFVQTDRLLSQYCLRDRAVQFRVLAGHDNLAEGGVNFENPNLRVGLPVFSIHGNHDYPHGESKLSAMDVPSSSGLINYFGKKDIDEDGTLKLNPILIEKGRTRLALYGLGHIAEQRIGNVFRKPNAVQWMKPSELWEYEEDSWFTLFVLHQNRVQRGFTNTTGWIEERHLAAGFENLDFVLWGHEHQCITETQSSSVGMFEILQPGSTVATSLAEGEADAKHVFILEVVRDPDGEIQHRVIKQRLPGVRPFRFESLFLAEQHGVYASQEHSIKEFVRWKLESMVAECYRDDPEMLPLIRLRIDYTGFDLIRTQEIQKRFAGKVANPEDMLLWVKKTKKKQKQILTGAGFGSEVQEPGLMDELIMSELKGNLKMLSVQSCTSAFQSVILTNSNSSIRAVFSRQAEKFHERLMENGAVMDEETARDLAKKLAAEMDAEEPQPTPSAPSPNTRRRQTSSDEEPVLVEKPVPDVSSLPTEAVESTPTPQTVIKQEPTRSARRNRHPPILRSQSGKRGFRVSRLLSERRGSYGARGKRKK